MCRAARFREWTPSGVRYQFRFKSLAAVVGTDVRRIHVRFLFVVQSAFTIERSFHPLEVRGCQRGA
jgi:hypothetical protein